jgi:hypothetical protein
VALFTLKRKIVRNGMDNRSLYKRIRDSGAVRQVKYCLVDKVKHLSDSLIK